VGGAGIWGNLKVPQIHHFFEDFVFMYSWGISALIYRRLCLYSGICPVVRLSQNNQFPVSTPIILENCSPRHPNLTRATLPTKNCNPSNITFSVDRLIIFFPSSKIQKAAKKSR
jgi:hypothetical protein